MMYNTLLLDQSRWDLVLDASGNIAMANPPYAIAQDVASACKTFLGEVYYDTQKGIPYFDEILGRLPPAPLLSSLIEKEAKTISGVVQSLLIITSKTDRDVSAQLQVIDEAGVINNVKF